MPFRLNLICHGMMLFLYDTKDHFTILIPKPPQDDQGNNMHEISLTTAIGNTTNQNMLKTAQGDYVRGVYELSLEATGKLFVRSPANTDFCPNRGQGPDSTKDVVLYQVLHPLLEISPFNPGDPGCPIWFEIRIPYPSHVRGLRRQCFTDPQGFPPYLPYDGSATRGQAVKHFTIRPNGIAGIHVFTYDDVPDGSVVTRPGPPDSPLTPNGATHLNLHLYSEGLESSPDHIEQFNNMVSFINDIGAEVPLDLEVNPQVKESHPFSLPDPPTQLNTDLTLADIQSLGELITPVKFECERPVHLVDPVECLQGWGT